MKQKQSLLFLVLVAALLVVAGCGKTASLKQVQTAQPAAEQATGDIAADLGEDLDTLDLDVSDEDLGFTESDLDLGIQ